MASLKTKLDEKNHRKSHKESISEMMIFLLPTKTRAFIENHMFLHTKL